MDEANGDLPDEGRSGAEWTMHWIDDKLMKQFRRMPRCHKEDCLASPRM
jgi:hypothetical protein